MTEYKAQDTDIVFALDIGTRSVVGIVGTPVGDRLKVLGIEMEEHKNRAMMDGQIDNIQQVADLARIVTERLERQLKVHLEKVCVAQLDVRCGLKAEPSHWSCQTASPLLRSRSASWKPARSLRRRRHCRWMRRIAASFFWWAIRLRNTVWTDIPYPPCWGMAAKTMEADVVATFLPGEVVESLYAAHAIWPDCRWPA